MKRIVTTIMIVSMFALLAGCGAKEPANEVKQEEEQEEIVEEETTDAQPEETQEEVELPPTVDELKTAGVLGEIDGIQVEMWIVPEATWNDEVVAYRLTNKTSNDLLVGLEYAGYAEDGYSTEFGVGSTMFLKAGESGVDYIGPLSDGAYYFDANINSRNVDANTKEVYESVSSEEYIENGEVNYTIYFPSDGMGFKYVIAYTDADGKIVACDSLQGGTSGDPWYDSFIAPEASYESYETSVHDTSL